MGNLTVWRTIFAAVAAFCSYALIQTDITVAPIAKFAIGGVLVVLAVLSPQTAVSTVGNGAK